MKKLFFLFVFFVIVLLTACQEDVATLKEGIDGAFPTTNSMEKNNDNTGTNVRKELSLELKRPNQEPFHIVIEDKLPILMSYLKQFEKPEKEINRIRSSYLLTNNKKDYFLVSYSCGSKQCDQLLLEYNQEEIQSFHVSEASFYQDSIYDNNYLTFLFGRNEGSEVLRNQVVTFNLEEFQKIQPPEDLTALETFEYPIPSIEWSDGTLIVTIADLENTTYENIKKWYENKKLPIQLLKWNFQ